MLRKIIIGAVVALSCLATTAIAQEKTFNLYGFADARMLGTWFDKGENSIIWTEGAEGLQFRMEHVNIYGDWRPHSKIRFLTELGFHWQPHGFGADGGTFGLDLTNVTDSLSHSSTFNNERINLVPDGPTEVATVTLQRAWVDLLLNQYANIRVGKFLTPVGIWNVDHGSPALITVRQPYMIGLLPIFPRLQYGVMYHGGAYLGDADLNYKLFISKSQSDSSNVVMDELADFSVGLNVKAVLPVLSQLEIGATVYTGMNTDYMVTGKSDPNAILTGSMQFLTDVVYEKEYVSDSREIAWGTDLKVKPIAPLTLQTEFNYKTMEDQRPGVNADSSTSKVWGYYFLGAYKFRVNDKFNFSPYAMYGTVGSEDASYNPTPSFLRSGVIDGVSSVLGGINFNFFTYYTFKAEYARILFDGGKTLTALGATEEQLYEHVLNLQVAVAF